MDNAGREMEQLRSELKSFERAFKSKHGRPPGKEDIKANEIVSEMYKNYQAMRRHMLKPSSSTPDKKSSTLTTPKKSSRTATSHSRKGSERNVKKSRPSSLFSTETSVPPKTSSTTATTAMMTEETPRKKAHSWLTGVARASPMHRKWGASFLSIPSSQLAEDPFNSSSQSSHPSSQGVPLSQVLRKEKEKEEEEEEEILLPSPAKKDAKKFKSLFELIKSPAKPKSQSFLVTSQNATPNNSLVDFIPPELPNPTPPRIPQTKQTSLPFSSTKSPFPSTSTLSKSKGSTSTTVSRLGRMNAERLVSNFDDERGPGTADVEMEDGEAGGKKKKTRKKPPTNKLEVKEPPEKRARLFSADLVHEVDGEGEKLLIKEYKTFPKMIQAEDAVQLSQLTDAFQAPDVSNNKQEDEEEKLLPADLMDLLSLSSPKTHVTVRDQYQQYKVKRLLHEPSLALEAKRKGLEDLDDELGDDEERDESEEWDDDNEGWKDTKEALVDLEEDWGDIY